MTKDGCRYYSRQMNLKPENVVIGEDEMDFLSFLIIQLSGGLLTIPVAWPAEARAAFSEVSAMRALIHARVATHKGAGEDNSLAQQIDLCQRYGEEHGLDIVGVITKVSIRETRRIECTTENQHELYFSWNGRNQGEKILGGIADNITDRESLS